MPLGDSITQGIPTPQTGSYRTVLWRMLKAASYDVDFVGPAKDGPGDIDRDHAGYNGATISRYPQDPGYPFPALMPLIHGFVNDYDPDVLLVCLGTNDMYWFNQNNKVRGTTARMDSLLDTIRAYSPDAKILVASLLPTKDAYFVPIKAEFRDSMRKWCDVPGDNLYFVDMFTAFPNPAESPARSAEFDGLMADGLHPNDSGYALMARTWYPVLTALLGQTVRRRGTAAPRSDMLALTVNGAAGTVVTIAGARVPEIMVSIFDSRGMLVDAFARPTTAAGRTVIPLCGRNSRGGYPAPGQYMLSVKAGDAGATCRITMRQ